MQFKKRLHIALFDYRFIIVLFLCALNLNTQAQKPAFVENKGQWDSSVKYRHDNTYRQIFLEQNAIRFNLIDAESYDALLSHPPQATHFKYIKAHSYLMQFENANPNCTLKAEGSLEHYNNYFIGKNPEHWAKFVKSYETVRYEDLYPHTDMQIYFSPTGIKYDIIIKKGGDYRSIKVNYQGVSSMRIKKNGNLIVKTSVGKIIEQAPIVYQIINGEKHYIKSAYLLKNKTVSYQLEERFNPDYDLIIDPNLIFSTYSGSTSNNWGFTATSDQLDNVYQGGIIFNTGYPSTLGAYQYSFAGGENIPNTNFLGCDMVFSKYSDDGSNLLWATYLGGSASEELPNSMVVNEFNELLIMGTTGSFDYPTTPNAYDNYFNGGTPVSYMDIIRFSQGTDLVVSRLSEDGSELLASTFIGGYKNDGLNWRNGYNIFSGNHKLYNNYGDASRGEIICTKNSEVWVASTTFSNNFPIVNGFQTSFGGMQDGIVFQLSRNLEHLTYSSFLGGSKDDAAFSLDLDSNEDVYLCGGTLSPNFPCSENAYQNNLNGDSIDAFVTHISQYSNQILHSTLFGSENYDQAYFVRLNRYDEVYIMGQTYATDTTLIYNADYNTRNSGQFIAKFQTNLDTLIWSTVFGTGSGKPNISPTAFAVDKCDRLYTSGWGRDFIGFEGNSFGDILGTKNMEITADAIQDTTDGQDFYIMQLAGDASQLLYATYFGEIHYGLGESCGKDHVDGGTSRFDKKGDIYQSVCASCGSPNPGANTPCNAFPTTPNAYSPNSGSLFSGSSGCNNAVFKISFASDLTVADFSTETYICISDTAYFQNTSNGNSFHWNFNDNGATSDSINPKHLFSIPGNHTVELIAIDSSTCNISDTIRKTIHVLFPRNRQLDSLSTCLNDSILIGFPPMNEHTYTWIPETGLSDSHISNPMALPDSSQNYLIIDTKVCPDTVSQFIEVRGTDHILSINNDTIICPNQNILLEANTSIPVDSILWSESPDFSTLLNTDLSESILVTPLETTTYYCKSITTECQIEHIDSVKVEIDFFQTNVIGNTSICQGDSSLLELEIDNNRPFEVIWTPASAFSGSNTQTPVIFSALNNTTVHLRVTDDIGCIVEDELEMTVFPFEPEMIVENNLCFGGCQGNAKVIVNGTPPYIYNWNNGESTDSLSHLCTGIYSVIVSDDNECTDTLTAIINSPEEISINYTITPTSCDKDTAIGAIDVNVTGGTPPYQYYWSNGDTTASINELTYGNYTLTVIDSNTCSKTFYFKVNDDSDLQIGLGANDILCNGDCNGKLWVAIINGGQAPYSFQWNTGDTTAEITDLCEGIYHLTVMDSMGCLRRIGDTLLAPPSLYTELVTQQAICHHDTTWVAPNVQGGSPPYQYTWDDSSTAYAKGYIEGQHYVVITDSHLCSDTVFFAVSSPDSIIYELEITEAICPTSCTGEIDIQSEGGVLPHYYYLDNQKTNLQNIKNICPGEHLLEIVDHLGCVIKLVVDIPAGEVLLPLSIEASPEKAYQGEEIQLTATYYDKASYYWQPENLIIDDAHIYNPKARINTNTAFEVLLVDSLNCEHKAEIMLKLKEVICDEPYIDIPNAFSPNNDLVNDTYRVKGALIEDIEMNIYNRWGEMVYQINQVTDSWDGTFKGKEVDSGVFVYQLRITCIDGKEFKKSGNITVIR